MSNGDGPADNDMELDEMLDLLGNRERRYLLNCLQEEVDPTVSLDEAAKYVTNQIADRTGRRPNEDDIKVQLEHYHIPRLADDDIVDYDARSNEIRYQGHDQLEAFHEYVEEFDRNS